MKATLQLFFRAAVLIMLVTACSASLNLLRHTPLPFRGEWSRHVETRAQQAGLQFVGIGALQHAVSTGSPRLLDARPMADFRAGHIPGAQALPFELATELLTSMQIELQREQPIITYCARNDCDEGLELALFLRRAGYTNAVIFAGGLAEWRASGGHVEAGP